MLKHLPPRIDLGAYMLRALRPDDAPAWYAYLSDPEVTQLTSYDVSSIGDVRRMIDYYMAGYSRQQSNRWALVEKDSDVLIGTCGFYRWDVHDGIGELGYDLARNYWGKGIMTQAVHVAVRWGFTELRANQVQATVMVGNVASARVLEKCGFSLEGTLHEYKICRGQPRDFWTFALLRREYHAEEDNHRHGQRSDQAD